MNGNYNLVYVQEIFFMMKGNLVIQFLIFGELKDLIF